MWKWEWSVEEGREQQLRVSLQIDAGYGDPKRPQDVDTIFATDSTGEMLTEKERPQATKRTGEGVAACPVAKLARPKPQVCLDIACVVLSADAFRPACREKSKPRRMTNVVYIGLDGPEV
jgi:hypothetical protein